MDDILYGKNSKPGTLSIEVDNDTVYRFTRDGVEKEKSLYWVLTNEKLDNYYTLDGTGFFKFAYKFNTLKEKRNFISFCKQNNYEFYNAYNHTEAHMLKHGEGLFRDLPLDKLRVLSFDIETTGIAHNDDSKILLISNTYRCETGKVWKHLFSFDEYENQFELIRAWCNWVRMVDPDIILGHNVFGFDLPYLNHCAKLYGTKLKLGRMNRTLKFSNYERKFRKDGSQSYSYNDVSCFGRHIIDTFFLAIKYDTARNYPNYKLKDIIQHEGLEKEDRQHYDASKIREDYKDLDKWEKIKAYAIDDADDALKLFDLMIPPFYEYAKYIPKSFQQVINTATGSQLNSLMMRSYLQDNKTLPKTTDTVKYEGAISYGNPGLYENVFKVDVASMYPSIILHYNIDNAFKDPCKSFIGIVRHFTSARLLNKKLAKETGERKYKDLSDAQKIIINSAYGFMGAPGLLFNSPSSAAEITKYGREILKRGIKWAEDKGYQIVNVDTDSFSYTGSDGYDLEDLNKQFDGAIKWEEDGHYKKVLVVKTKNYVLQTFFGCEVKGSALKATMKEEALKEFINRFILSLMDSDYGRCVRLYGDYVRSISRINIKGSILSWSSRKTITAAVLNPKRTTEQRVLDAIKGTEYFEGDKIHVFFKSDTELCTPENFDGTYDKNKLYEKLFKTVKIFENVIDINDYPNYKLKKNKGKLDDLLNPVDTRRTTTNRPTQESSTP